MSELTEKSSCFSKYLHIIFYMVSCVLAFLQDFNTRRVLKK